MLHNWIPLFIFLPSLNAQSELCFACCSADDTCEAYTELGNCCGDTQCCRMHAGCRLCANELRCQNKTNSRCEAGSGEIEGADYSLLISLMTLMIVLGALRLGWRCLCTRQDVSDSKSVSEYTEESDEIEECVPRSCSVSDEPPPYAEVVEEIVKTRRSAHSMR